MTTLEDIRTKTRRLTASPSELQLATEDLDEYINTFYLNDLPQHLKIYDLKESATFYTEPNVDVYDLTVNPSFTATTPRAYYSVQPPVYISGYETYFTQSRTEFFRLYPFVNADETTPGTGIAGAYAYTITNTPVLTNNVTISAVDVGGNALIAIDDGAGGFTGDVTGGAIDYITGAITALTFTGAIPATENINVQTVPYVASRPSASLFFDNTFTLRPVPDKTYRVEIDVFIYPTALLNDADNPEVQFLWQLLAIGAAKKIFEDRGDLEGVDGLAQQFDEQMRLCMRRTLEQMRTERAATIYSSQAEGFGNVNYNNFRG